jgi:UDP-glucose 4-epimerase
MLRDAGHHVAIVDNLSTGREENIPQDVPFYRCDIRDSRLGYVLVTERPEVVCHLAAQMSVRVSIQDPRNDASINVEGTVNLLELAREVGVEKIVYASTGGAVYGEPRYLPCDEHHPVQPMCQYGITKHTVEHYLELYWYLYGLDYTVLRFPNVYGPRQDPHGEAGVVAIFAGQMLDDADVTIYGDGEQQRDFVYVGDVARAHLSALASGSQRIINLGSGQGTSVNDIFNGLSAILGYSRPPRFELERLGEVYRIYLTGDRAREYLGWRATTPLAEGLRHTVDSVIAARNARRIAAEEALATG